MKNPAPSGVATHTYKPDQDAVKQYEDALKVSERLNRKNSNSRHLTMKQAFLKMSDQERLSLFH
ncbi:MAG TPA: hypothetical protein PKV73_08395 [Agriterribacter sp.]|nr:hypothetical protein [Chitinophagaceae bacterium]HRP31896.1 hypothetical protein [Agriterribacter sp.]